MWWAQAVVQGRDDSMHSCNKDVRTIQTHLYRCNSSAAFCEAPYETSCRYMCTNTGYSTRCNSGCKHQGRKRGRNMCVSTQHSSRNPGSCVRLAGSSCIMLTTTLQLLHLAAHAWLLMYHHAGCATLPDLQHLKYANSPLCTNTTAAAIAGWVLSSVVC